MGTKLQLVKMNKSTDLILLYVPIQYAFLLLLLPTLSILSKDLIDLNALLTNNLFFSRTLRHSTLSIKGCSSFPVTTEFGVTNIIDKH